MTEIRWSRAEDSPRLAELHAAAWRYTYAGIIPGLALERMIGRRGPRWWRTMHQHGARALLLEADADIAGYATLGPGRSRKLGRHGEIYELYLRPEWQGMGFGRRLFGAARRRLAAKVSDRLAVWSLADNQIGCRFYRGLGGVESGRVRDLVGGARLEKIGFAWSAPAAG